MVYCTDAPADPNCVDQINLAVGGDKIPNQYIVFIKKQVSKISQSDENNLRALTDEVKSNGGEVLYIYTNAIIGFAIKAPNKIIINQLLNILHTDTRVSFTEQDETMVPFSATNPPNQIKRIDASARSC